MSMTLDEIKQHPSYPFLDFATNDASFLLLELFWTQVAREALGEDLSASAVPLMQAQQEDGNPILFFRLPDLEGGLGRAARVILKTNEAEQPALSDATRPNKFDYYRPVDFLADSSPARFDVYSEQRIDALLINYDMAFDAIAAVTDMLRAFFIECMDLAQIEPRALAHYAAMGAPDVREEAAYWAGLPEEDDDAL